MILSCCAAPGSGPNRPDERVAAILAPLGLHLHPDKTRLVSLAQGRDGFDFLGFHHRLVKSWKWRGRYYLKQVAVHPRHRLDPSQGAATDGSALRQRPEWR